MLAPCPAAEMPLYCQAREMPTVPDRCSTVPLIRTSYTGVVITPSAPRS